MSTKFYDVIVVGCGPGGAAAGRFSARAGLKTLIIEKKREIGLPIKDFDSVIYSLSEFEEIAQVKIDQRCIERRVGQNVWFSPSGVGGEGQPWPDGAVVDRRLLEKSLAVEAIRSGAEIMLDARVVDLIREDGVVKGVVVSSGSKLINLGCSVVIGADGAYSNVGHLAKLKVGTDCTLALGYEFAGVIPLKPSPITTYEYYLLPHISRGFFANVAPRAEDDRAAFGVICSHQFLASRQTTIRQAFKEVVKHLQSIGRYDLSKASPISMMAGVGVGTIRSVAEEIVSDGVILIGDSARRPIAGYRWGAGGMLTATTTGRFAAEAAIEAINGGDVTKKGLRIYLDKIKESLQGKSDLITEANAYYFKILDLSPDKLDWAVKDIGKHIAALHLVKKGALPLANCLEPIKEWFQQER